MTTESTLSRRSLLRAATAVAATVAPLAANAVGPGDDPIFAAIEAHRRAMAARFNDGADSNLDAVEAEYETLEHLFNTVPTSRAGLVALFAFLSSPIPGGGGRAVLDDLAEQSVAGDLPGLVHWARAMELAHRRTA
jgi:hypothetical protein